MTDIISLLSAKNCDLDNLATKPVDKNDLHILVIVSNFIYLIGGLILLTHNHCTIGIALIIGWLISHIYHKDRSDTKWRILDRLLSAICIIYIIIIYYNKICSSTQIIFLLITVSCFIMSRRATITRDYNIYHSCWHILSGLFITQLILVH